MREHDDDSGPRRRRDETDLARFAPAIPFRDVERDMPPLSEAAHWGEVILLEDYVSVMHADGTTTFGTHIITMLHGSENLEEWDRLERLYDVRYWRPHLRRARLYLPNGDDHKAKVLDGALDDYGELRLLRVEFAPLRPGVVLDYKTQDEYYTRESPAGLWGKFLLQTGNPCRRRRFTLAVARSQQIRVVLHHGAEEPIEDYVDGYHVRTWERKNVAGIEWDRWPPPPRDFLPWIDYSTIYSWQKVCNHYLKDLKPTEAERARSQVRRMTDRAVTQRDKAAALFQYAARDVRYGRPESETEIPMTRPLRTTMDDLRGDCKDKSALLVTMLAEIGVPAKTAILMTRDDGKAPYLPSPRFNHAIVLAQLGDREVLMDPAAGPFTFGDLPTQDQGVMALVLDPKEARYVEFPPAQPQHHGIELVCRGELTSEGRYRFEAQMIARGERAAMFRSILMDRNVEMQSRQMQEFISHDLPGVEVIDVKIDRVDDLSGDFQFRYSAVLAQLGRRIENLHLIRIPWMEKLEAAGPFSVKSRPVPFTVPVNTIQERHEIELPPGHSSMGLPYECAEDCEWARYRCMIVVRDGVLKCERRVLFRGGIVMPVRFPDLKRFWQACARIDAADVVFVRPTH